MAGGMEDKPEEPNSESVPTEERKKKKDKKKKENDVDPEQEEPPTDDNDKKKKKKEKKKKEKAKKDDIAPAEEEGRHNAETAESEQNQDVPPENETEQSDEKQKKKKKKKKKNENEDDTAVEGEDNPKQKEGEPEEIQDMENDKKKDKKKKKKKKQKEDGQPVETDVVANGEKVVPGDSQPDKNETEKTDIEKQEVAEKEGKKKDKKKKNKETENEEMNENLNNQEDTNEKKKKKKKNKEDNDKKEKKKNEKDYKQDNTAKKLSTNGSTTSNLSEENYQKILLLGKTFARTSVLAREHNMKISQTNDRLTKVEEILTQLETTQNTYQFIWKIENFKDHFMAARTGKKMAVYCPEVESHHYGYKIGITLCPNGDGVGLNTHMSLFFCILRGKYDDMLPWPFSSSLRFSLMDQTPPKKNKKRDNIVGIFTPNASPANEPFLGKPTSARNKGLGLPRFASLNKVFDNEDKYILDDTIFIKIEIDLNGLETQMDEIIKI